MSNTKIVFNQEMRLKKQSDFDQLFTKSVKSSLNGLTIRVRENGLSFCRLGIMVSRKHGNAVQRNRIKRVIREVFRKDQIDNNIKYDILVSFYKKLSQMKNDEVAGFFRHILNKIIKS